MPLQMLLYLLMMSGFNPERPLPALHGGSVVAGPGRFQHNGPLRISGHVSLRNLTLDLRGPIIVSAGAVLDLEHVDLQVSDPPGAPNGTSGLNCEGPARLSIRSSTMGPIGSAHPMWRLQGNIEIDDFRTSNSEFHLDHVNARLRRFKIFELEISRESHVMADHLELVFLSTHSGDDDHLSISDIPADKAFTRKLRLGSGASADLTAATVQLFLVYLHGNSEAALSHMGRVQLAIFPRCTGKLRLPDGRLGSAAPLVVPAPGESTCPFHFALTDVNVDTWDVYAGGEADLLLTGSRIDELTANGNAKLDVRQSQIFADWLSLAGNAELKVEDSTVGALRLASSRPDLATSQIRVSGRSRAIFDRVRFDCGLVAADQAHVEIRQPLNRPQYIRKSGSAQVLVSEGGGAGDG